ncbi:hypothetical protein [Sporosarcina sp. UB5]|uniref:hypothetical protein n=1 Tax=Sporosarcina sp. UB5 TaxID=3047463 RepID=UPI003D7B064B
MKFAETVKRDTIVCIGYSVYPEKVQNASHLLLITDKRMDRAKFITKEASNL